MKPGFFSVFLLLTKFLHERIMSFSISFSLKEIPGCPNKEYNLVFKHFHENIRAYPRSKKTALTNDWESIANWQESEQNEALRTSLVCPKYSWGGLRELWNEETLQFFSSFKLGNSISST